MPSLVSSTVTTIRGGLEGRLQIITPRGRPATGTVVSEKGVGTTPKVSVLASQALESLRSRVKVDHTSAFREDGSIEESVKVV